MNPPDLLKEEKSSLRSLQFLVRHIRMEWSMHRIVTFGDYLRKGLGHTEDHIKHVLHYRDNELEQPLTYPELKELLDDLRINLEVRWYLKRNEQDIIGVTEPTICKPEEDLSIILQSTDERDSNYGLPPSDKELCNLFWFQKKFAKKALDKLTKDKLKAIMLIASAGTGKTYILGAIIRRLLDTNFHIGRTISPWPYCYITKASVVEQTKRVLQEQFSIDIHRECIVTNYDQMRATFGGIFLEEKTQVVNGEEKSFWKWKTKIHPLVFILDECQSAKNDISSQAKIVNAIADIEDDVQVIFSSATPFTRVSEGKYFVLNCRKDGRLF